MNICKIVVYAIHDCKNEQEMFEKTKGLKNWLDTEFEDNWTGNIDSFYDSGCSKSKAIGHNDFHELIEKYRKMTV